MKQRTKKPATLAKNKVIDGEVVEKSIVKKDFNQPMPVEQSPETLISLAIEKGVPVETLERLLEMQTKINAAKAKKAFDEAMAKFQAECPVIEKTKGVPEKGQENIPFDKKKWRYKYAPLDSIVAQTKELIASNGLSYTLQVKHDEKMLTVVCTVKHTAGHSEQSEFSVPISTEQYMTDSQKYGARSTFAKRYAFCNAFGIMTGDEDTDEYKDEKPAKEKAINYLNLLKEAIYKKGARNPETAIETYNSLTGENITAFPAINNPEAKRMYEALTNSPLA